jgi:hypothetical protein
VERQRDNYRDALTTARAELKALEEDLRTANDALAEHLALEIMFRGERDSWKAKAEDHERQREMAAIDGANTTCLVQICELELTETREQLETAKLVLASSKKVGRKRLEILRYGSMVEDLGEIDAHNLPAVNGSFDQSRPFVEGLRITADAWWRPTVEEARGQPDGSLVGTLVAKIERCETSNMRHSIAAFLEWLDTNHDARRWVAPVYVSYRAWRTDARELAVHVKNITRDSTAYRAWRRAEIAFGADLKRALTHRTLARAKELIEADEKSYGRIDDITEG